MYSDPCRKYRESTVHSSGPADVFILCYDEVIRLLHSAARAVEADNIEKKTHDLNRVLAFIVHLNGALDFEQGGEVARWLSHFYTLVREQIFEGSVQLNPDLLRQAAGYFVDVRRMWEEARAMGSANPTDGSAFSKGSFSTPQDVTSAIAPHMAGTTSPSDWSA